MSLQVAEEIPLITLVGPPNSGKTSIFNILSGKNYKTVNYPGSTVEYQTSRLLSKFNLKANLSDSPGLISLAPNSLDEKVAVNSLYSSPAENNKRLIINTVDASQLSRHLLLTMQLIESGFKVIVALTMTDILQRKNMNISENQLSEMLGCEVVAVNSRTKQGIDKLICAISQQLDSIRKKRGEEKIPVKDISDDKFLLDTFEKIEEIVNKVTNEYDIVKRTDLSSANKELKIVNPLNKINGISPDQTTLNVDKVLLHKYWGFIFFILIMGLTFTSIFWLAEPLMGMVDDLFSSLNKVVQSSLSPGWFTSLLSDGLINGTGAVLVFVPQIIILFIILGVLEDSGYLARGAMLIDKPLSKIGLNGRSFVPMLSGFACAIPAMMAARTIPNRKERLLTIFIIPLMSCSARLPVYALLIAYLIPRNKPWIGGFLLAGIYLFSIISSVIVAAFVNKFKNKIIDASDSSSFILELPTYRIPNLNSVLTHAYHSSKQYLLRAGPVILVFSLVLWFFTYFPDIEPEINSQNLSQEEITQFKEIERFENSYASQFGKILQPVMSPIGMDWRIGVSLVSAFAAREVFVSSLALIFKVTGEDENLGSSLLNSMKTATIGESGKKLFTPATILGLIVFFVFALQCLSTVAVAKKETGGWKIPVLQVIVFTSIAYIVTLITVNGLRLLGVE